MKHRLALFVLYYFRFWAKIQLAKVRPDIIGITGSAGKSSTRNALATLFVPTSRLKVSWKANSESGIPLDILDIAPTTYSPFDWLRMILLAPFKVMMHWQTYDTYIVEMGIDSPVPPKNMEYLLTIISPRIGIFLNALPVHSEAFDYLVGASDYKLRHKRITELVAHEKGKLFKRLPKDGIAIANADDQEVMRQTRHLKAMIMTFGHATSSDVVIAGMHYSKVGTRMEFRHETEVAAVVLPFFLPSHFASSFAAALCAYIACGNQLTHGCGLLSKNFLMPPGRMSLFEGVNGSTIIDSTYNASAGPVIDALQMLPELTASRRVALLGDLHELGKEAEGEHIRIMAIAIRKVDMLFLVGPLMKQYAVPWLLKHHFPYKWFATAPEAGEALQTYLTRGDVLLAKGSQNTIFLEAALELILAHKRDVTKLCRRGSFWQTQRNLTFSSVSV